MNNLRGWYQTDTLGNRSGGGSVTSNRSRWSTKGTGADSVVNSTIRMGPLGYPNSPSSVTDESSKRSGDTLRLKAPEIRKFSGANDEWPEWKIASATTFLATGFGEIISENYLGDEHHKNQIVYAMLSNATLGGTAHWLLTDQKMNEMDGHTAWMKLKDWYEGDKNKSEMAASLRNKIHGAVLIPGIEATAYINDFMQPYNKLSLIPECRMSEAEAKDIFLDNIHDPEYMALKEYLSTALETRSLRALVLEIQKKALAINRNNRMISE